MRKLLYITLPAIFLIGCGYTGSGEKVGQIIKLNHAGFWNQTWEGESIRGGMNNGSGASSTIFNFTVKDQNLLPLVQDALDKQYEVKLEYVYDWPAPFSSDSDGAFLTKITKLSDPGHKLQLEEK